MDIQIVSVDSIRTTQEESRLDPGIIQRVMEVLVDGWDPTKVPPLKGYFYTDHVEMTDGHHRYAAAIALGYKEVPVVNEAAMKRGDRSSYAALIRRYRKLIQHPLSSGR